jgi:L-methionine (R)-S-oxide reductase
MIAHNVKELDNYIACDDETLSEIVVPCFIGEGEQRRLRTVLDIDSPNIGTFDETDDKGLRKLISLIYP